MLGAPEDLRPDVESGVCFSSRLGGRGSWRGRSGSGPRLTWSWTRTYSLWRFVFMALTPYWDFIFESVWEQRNLRPRDPSRPSGRSQVNLLISFLPPSKAP